MNTGWVIKVYNIEIKNVGFNIVGMRKCKFIGNIYIVIVFFV